jgi:hypothetical protein
MAWIVQHWGQSKCIFPPYYFCAPLCCCRLLVGSHVFNRSIGSVAEIDAPIVKRDNRAEHDQRRDRENPSFFIHVHWWRGDCVGSPSI